MRKKPAVQRTAVSPQRSSYSRKGSPHPRSSALRLPSPGRGRRRQKENKARTTKLIKKPTPLPPHKESRSPPKSSASKGQQADRPIRGAAQERGERPKTDRPHHAKNPAARPAVSWKRLPYPPNNKHQPHKKKAAHLAASGSFYKPRQKRSHADAYTNLITCIPLKIREVTLFFLRKEVIQPQVPLRLPCYDLVPITEFIFGA